MPRILRPSLLLAAALIAGVAGVRAADSLASSSPFLPPSATGAPAAENTPLELRGILADGGGYRFSIFDPVRHVSTWVRLNERGHDFVVKAHDVAHDTVTLDFQGRVLTLPLRTTKVVVVAPPVINAGAPAAGAQGAAGPVVLNPSPADEIARFNRVKEEIARRRALREQNAANPPTRK